MRISPRENGLSVKLTDRVQELTITQTESASKRDERLISLTEQGSRQKWISLGGKNDLGSRLTTSARETTGVHQTVLTRKRRKLKRNDCAVVMLN